MARKAERAPRVPGRVESYSEDGSEEPRTEKQRAARDHHQAGIQAAARGPTDPLESRPQRSPKPFHGVALSRAFQSKVLNVAGHQPEDLSIAQSAGLQTTELHQR